MGWGQGSPGPGRAEAPPRAGPNAEAAVTLFCLQGSEEQLLDPGVGKGDVIGTPGRGKGDTRSSGVAWAPPATLRRGVTEGPQRSSCHNGQRRLREGAPEVPVPAGLRLAFSRPLAAAAGHAAHDPQFPLEPGQGTERLPWGSGVLG